MDEHLIEGFRAIVGERGIVSGEAMRGYETGARYDEGRAALVVRPATTEEVSRVVAFAVKNGIPFVPQAGNTGLVGGSTPDASRRQIVVSVERLASPLVVDAENRLVEVGAGVRLSKLNETLATRGLFLPIDLGADPMVGGMIATNTGGARFIRYGGMRRQVLGLEAVLPDADGTVLDLTGALRKDNSHLDIKQLLIGSCGALGIVTRAVLEVQHLPEEIAAALLVPTSDAALAPLLMAVERACGAYLSAFEGMSRNAVERAFAHVRQLRNPFGAAPLPPYMVLVELSRTRRAGEGEETLDRVLETALAGLLEGDEPLLSDALMGRAEELWAIRHSLSEGLKASGHVTAFDLSLRRSDLAAFRAEAIARLGEAHPDVAVCDFGHLGDGGIHFNLIHECQPEPEELAGIKRLVLDLAVGKYRGSFSGEHGLGRSNRAVYEHYTPALVQDLARHLCRAFAEFRQRP